jgi:deoxyxylulose-5-phosphate synthase
VITTKGKGLKQAEDQVKYHAQVNLMLNLEIHKTRKPSSKISRCFGLTLLDLARKTKNNRDHTAMPSGSSNS